MLMFAVLPKSEEFLFPEDATFWENENDAFEDALDWSVQLNGASVIVYKDNGECYDAISKVLS